MLIALFLAAAPAPMPIETFGNFAVACDNGKRCMMVSLTVSDDGSDAGSVNVELVRDAGPSGATTVTIIVSGATGTMQAMVDGKHVADGRVTDADVGFNVTGAAAERLARAMVAGSTLTIAIAGKGTESLPLTGASASLRFVDAAQGRAGGVTAFAAVGPAPAAKVPAAPPLPKVVAVTTPSGDGPAIGAKLRAVLMKETECDQEDLNSSDLGIDTYPLDARRAPRAGAAAVRQWRV